MEEDICFQPSFLCGKRVQLNMQRGVGEDKRGKKDKSGGMVRDTGEMRLVNKRVCKHTAHK